MTDETEAKYCCLCGNKIVIGKWCDIEHQQFNFIAHIFGEPMLCCDCWRKAKRGKEE